MTAPPPSSAPSAAGAAPAHPTGGATNPPAQPPGEPPSLPSALPAASVSLPPPPPLPASSAPLRPPQPIPFPPHPAYFYPPQSAAAPPQQPFVPHLTYMEGQFAAQALLVEQQRRIKSLETELAQTQMELLRLRAQVSMPHQHPSQMPSHVPTHDPNSLRHHAPVMQQSHVPQPPHPPQTQPQPHPSSLAHHNPHQPQLPHTHPDFSSHHLPVSSSHQRPPSAHAQPPASLPVSGPSASNQPPSQSPSSNHTASTPAQPDEQKKARSRYWTPDEHARFLEGLRLFGQKDIKAISRHVGTRSATQVRTHAQKYYLRIERESKKAEQDGKTPPSAPGTISNGSEKIVNGRHATTSRNSASGGACGKGNTSETKGKRARSQNRDNSSPKHGTSSRSTDAGSKTANITTATGDSNLNSTKSEAKSSSGRKDGRGKAERASNINGTLGTSAARRPKAENIMSDSMNDVVNGTTQSEPAINQNEAHQPGENVISNLQGGLVPSQNPVPPNSEVMAHMTIPISTTMSYPPPPLSISAEDDTNQISQRESEPGMETVTPATQNYGEKMPHSKDANDIIATAVQNNKEPIAGGNSHGLPPTDPNLGTNNQRRASLDRAGLQVPEQTKEESVVAGEQVKDFGKRAAPPLSKRSPKKRLKRPPTLEPIASDAGSSANFAPGANMFPVGPKAATSTLPGAPPKPEQKIYSLGDAGSMSNLRALLRVPADDQAAGPSGSKPPTLKRNESSNSVLADLSKSVGVLSRSNSFISPSGKGVHRSNSILSLLSGLPTAMRESPSSDRLMMMEGGEDRVMATLKSMDTGGGATISAQAGPSTPGQNPIGAMGERSFSFSQLQHIGLDDLEDPNAVALALPDEQKWGDG